MMSATVLLANATGSSLPAAPGLIAWLPALAMIGGIIILGSTMMVVFQRRERSLKALSVQISSDLEEAKALRAQLEEVHTRASNMMVTAQRLAARLDERVAALDLASLRMNATRNALPRVAAPTPASPHMRARQQTPPHVIASVPATGMAAAELEALPQRAVATPVSRAAAVSVATESDPLRQQIYSLADAGKAPLAIARDLNEQVGKVELILALRGR